MSILSATTLKKDKSLQCYAAGFIGASAVLTLLLTSWSTPGEPIPPSLEPTRFTVAVLAGPKQAAQEAPENVENTAEVAIPTPAAKSAPIVVADRESSLPDAVKAAQNAEPASKVVVDTPAEVLPPSRVSMPGGKLMTEDAPLGDGDLDPFAIKPQQVYIRLWINSEGRPIKSGVVRSGGNQFRDSMILRVVANRTYDPSSLPIKMKQNGQDIWQLDLVLDYGTNDMLP